MKFELIKKFPNIFDILFAMLFSSAGHGYIMGSSSKNFVGFLDYYRTDIFQAVRT